MTPTREEMVQAAEEAIDLANWPEQVERLKAIVAELRKADPTCATCEHWCNGQYEGPTMYASYVKNEWRASCGKATDFYDMVDGYIENFKLDTPPTFGCRFYDLRKETT